MYSNCVRFVFFRILLRVNGGNDAKRHGNYYSLINVCLDWAHLFKQKIFQIINESQPKLEYINNRSFVQCNVFNVIKSFAHILPERYFSMIKIPFRIHVTCPLLYFDTIKAAKRNKFSVSHVRCFIAAWYTLCMNIISA